MMIQTTVLFTKIKDLIGMKDKNMNSDEVMQNVNKNFPSKDFCNVRHDALQKLLDAMNGKLWIIVMFSVANSAGIIGLAAAFIKG